MVCSKAKEEQCQLKTKILSIKRAATSLQHFQQCMPRITGVMLELHNAKDKLSKLQDSWAECFKLDQLETHRVVADHAHTCFTSYGNCFGEVGFDF